MEARRILALCSCGSDGYGFPCERHAWDEWLVCWTALHDRRYTYSNRGNESVGWFLGQQFSSEVSIAIDVFVPNCEATPTIYLYGLGFLSTEIEVPKSLLLRPGSHKHIVSVLSEWMVRMISGQPTEHHSFQSYPKEDNLPYLENLVEEYREYSLDG